MPKKSGKKSANAKGLKNGVDAGASDEESNFAANDNMSVISNISSGSFKDEAGMDTTPTEEVASEDLFEEKLKEAMDLATQKSAQGRTAAVDAITKAFLKKYTPEFADDRHATLADIIDKSLKRGKDSEQTAASNLLIVLCVQLGMTGSSEQVFREVRPTLTALLLDATASPKGRAAAAAALGTACFLSCEDVLADFEPVMDSLEKVFRVSYGPNTANLSPDTLALHTAALSSWTMLATLLPQTTVFKILESHIKDLTRLFDSTDVDLRIAAGEAMAVLFESACGVNEEDTFSLFEPVLPKLKELSTDSHKYRSRKDRKEQKSSFRDILKTLEEGEDYYEKVSINTREKLEIISWAQKKHYDSLCKTLSTGMNLHLSENEFLREVFQLGAVIPASTGPNAHKMSKQERHSLNQQAFKWRTQTRGKNRDKRSAVVT